MANPGEPNGPAQFLAAAELVRRHCIVSFTMGNSTPMPDLMVGLPDGQQFWVDVKGLSAPNAWLIKPKPAMTALYYILVLVGRERVRDRFFILTQSECNELIRRYLEGHPTAKPIPSFNWGDALPFENRWDILPAESLTPTALPRLAAACNCCLSWALPRDTHAAGVVNAYDGFLNLHTGPNTQSRIVSPVKNGWRVFFDETVNGWVRVSHVDGRLPPARLDE